METVWRGGHLGKTTFIPFLNVRKAQYSSCILDAMLAIEYVLARSAINTNKEAVMPAAAVGRISDRLLTPELVAASFTQPKEPRPEHFSPQSLVRSLRVMATLLPVQHISSKLRQPSRHWVPCRDLRTEALLKRSLVRAEHALPCFHSTLRNAIALRVIGRRMLGHDLVKFAFHPQIPQSFHQ